MRGPPSSTAVSFGLLLAFIAATIAIGCKPKPSVAEHREREIDGDPIALLPPSPTLVATVDARAVFHHEILMGSAVAAARALFPLDESAGFDASRDVDRLVLGEYGGVAGESGGNGNDFIVAATGRFDPEKLAKVTKTKDGSPIVSERYAGFSVETTGSVSYSALSPRLLLVGTISVVRRALDRAKAGAQDRAVKRWMSDTLETNGAPLAAAADFESEPIPGGAIGALDLSWLGGLRTARATGNFQPPGMNVAATLSYADAVQAQRGADGLNALSRWVKAIGPLLGGVRVQDLQIAAQERDLHCAFSLDDSTLRALGAIGPRFLPPSGR